MDTGKKINIVWFGIVLIFSSCASKINDLTEDNIIGGTPVKVVSVKKELLTETIVLNATSVFLLKTPVKSATNGYLQNVRIKQGGYVKRGDVLMEVITKEAQSIGKDISKLDTSFHFKGEINIKATGNGYISQLNFENGDYVQEGEQIAIINDEESFVFMLEFPYELTNLIKSNKSVRLMLPDSTMLNGTIDRALPIVDAASQTQNYLILVDNKEMIPENLNAKVFIVKSSKQNAFSIPKEALLTNETQSDYWVMKLLNDTTAVRVPVIVGIQTNLKAEILSPQFSETDKIVISGNYGLGDTAKVQMGK